MASNVPRNFIVNICLHEDLVLFTTEKINSSYSWSFIPVRDNNSTTSKQNSNKQTASGFVSETCSRVGFKN